MESSSETSRGSSESSGSPIGEHPDVVIEGPASGEHKQTFIILHGRGDKGEHFGPQLLLWHMAKYGNLETAFPNAKFVFPTAAKRRARVLNNASFNQWFDLRSLVDPEEEPDLQYAGLRESTEYVCGLLRSAIHEVGPENVVLWGLSQGSAIMLMTLLHWDGEPFAAGIGMCGWLPLRKRMLEAAAADSIIGPGEDDPVERSDKSKPNQDRVDQATACLREVVGLETGSKDRDLACKRIPVALFHGAEDEKVAVELGLDSFSFLKTMGIEARWRQYEGLDHWYSEQMLQDIVEFLVERCGFSAVTA